MSQDLFRRELKALAGRVSPSLDASVREQQKQLQRLHAMALRRAMRRIRKKISRQGTNETVGCDGRA